MGDVKTTTKQEHERTAKPSTPEPLVKEPRCLGQIGTTALGRPIYAVERADGQIVSVVIPGRDED